MKKFLFSQKYRFDLGYRFLTILNFGLLVFAVSEDIARFLYMSRAQVALLFVPAGFATMWLFGFIMDRIVRAQASEEKEFYARSPVWTKVFRQLDDIEEAISWMPTKRPRGK